LFLAVSGYHVFRDRRRFLGESDEPPEIAIPRQRRAVSEASAAEGATESPSTGTVDDPVNSPTNED